jgi:release factor glutamine methyltransferase
MNLFEFRNHFNLELQEVYDERERKSIFQRMVKHRLDLDGADVLLAKLSLIGQVEQEVLFTDLESIKLGEPIQYVLGVTEFYGLDIQCDSSALIPRPETEELVGWIVQENGEKPLNVLDIGTGTGCIPLALKNVRKGWEIAGLDVSEDALVLSKKNGLALNLDIQWVLCDILKESAGEKFAKPFDLIVSNPPYIPVSEKKDMSSLVVEFEPEIALFVPDEDPFIFYKSIALFAKQNLKPNGSIYLEIHEDSAIEMVDLLKAYGFGNLFMKKDMQGKNRMIKAQMLNLTRER